MTAPFSIRFGLFRAQWMDLVVWTLERAGPAFIKWGQWAATRPDLFPPDLCRALSRLQTAAPRHSFAQTRRIVEAAFNRWEQGGQACQEGLHSCQHHKQATRLQDVL